MITKGLTITTGTTIRSGHGMVLQIFCKITENVLHFPLCHKPATLSQNEKHTSNEGTLRLIAF
jgi:hypothetical protein